MRSVEWGRVETSQKMFPMEISWIKESHSVKSLVRFWTKVKYYINNKLTVFTKVLLVGREMIFSNFFLPDWAFSSTASMSINWETSSDCSETSGSTTSFSPCTTASSMISPSSTSFSSFSSFSSTSSFPLLAFFSGVPVIRREFKI